MNKIEKALKAAAVAALVGLQLAAVLELHQIAERSAAVARIESASSARSVRRPTCERPRSDSRRRLRCARGWTR